MRLVTAIAVLAVTLPAAMYVHQRQVVRTVFTGSGSVYAAGPSDYTTVRTHPSWEDPAAILISVGGIAVAAVLAAASAGRRFSVRRVHGTAA